MSDPRVEAIRYEFKRKGRRSGVRRHGVDPERYLAMYAEQGGRCVTCHTEDRGGINWNIDHDHKCCPGAWSCGDCVRGLLCGKCNCALGLAGESPQTLLRMIDYLTN